MGTMPKQPSSRAVSLKSRALALSSELALGRGEKLEDIEANMGMIIEGISTTKVAHELAQELDVYMPITQAIYQVIYEGKDIREAIHHMMSNEFKEENEWK